MTGRTGRLALAMAIGCAWPAWAATETAPDHAVEVSEPVVTQPAPQSSASPVPAEPSPAADSAATVPSEQVAAPSDEELEAPMQVSMDFEDANVKDVLKIFSKQTGVNVIAREDVGNRTITLYLEDVSILDALDQILNAADLTYERPQGSEIYIVKPKPQKPELTTETRVYRLKFARVSTSRLSRALEALSAKTPFEAQQLTTALSGVAGGGSTGASSSKQEVGVDTVIQKLLTEQGTLVVDDRTNSLVITEVAENFPRIEAVLNALDIKTAQIMIEAEVLETSLQALKDLGVEWGTGTEGSVLSIIGAQRATKFPFSLTHHKDSKPKVIEPESDQPDFTGPGQISLGTFDATLMNGLVQALERDTDTKVLARPKVLTLENESAVIRLTSQQAVAVQTTTVAAGSAITQTTPERMTTGVILVVTPEVNENGFITMLVEPSVTKTVPSEISSAIVDPKTRSARALVRVRHGHTLVLGGLIDRTERQVEERVPILSGIPLLGEAFKNKERSSTATELIVFVTPRILADPQVGTKMAMGQASLALREQEESPSRRDMIEESLKKLDP